MQLCKIVYIRLLLSDVFLLPELVKNINRSVDCAYFLVDVCKELVHHLVYASFLRLGTVKLELEYSVQNIISASDSKHTD